MQCDSNTGIYPDEIYDPRTGTTTRVEKFNFKEYCKQDPSKQISYQPGTWSQYVKGTVRGLGATWTAYTYYNKASEKNEGQFENEWIGVLVNATEAGQVVIAFQCARQAVQHVGGQHASPLLLGVGTIARLPYLSDLYTQSWANLDDAGFRAMSEEEMDRNIIFFENPWGVHEGMNPEYMEGVPAQAVLKPMGEFYNYMMDSLGNYVLKYNLAGLISVGYNYFNERAHDNDPLTIKLTDPVHNSKYFISSNKASSHENPFDAINTINNVLTNPEHANNGDILTATLTDAHLQDDSIDQKKEALPIPIPDNIQTSPKNRKKTAIPPQDPNIPKFQGGFFKDVAGGLGCFASVTMKLGLECLPIAAGVLAAVACYGYFHNKNKKEAHKDYVALVKMQSNYVNKQMDKVCKRYDKFFEVYEQFQNASDAEKIALTNKLAKKWNSAITYEQAISEKYQVFSQDKHKKLTITWRDPRDYIRHMIAHRSRYIYQPRLSKRLNNKLETEHDKKMQDIASAPLIYKSSQEKMTKEVKAYTEEWLPIVKKLGEQLVNIQPELFSQLSAGHAEHNAIITALFNDVVANYIEGKIYIETFNNIAQEYQDIKTSTKKQLESLLSIIAKTDNERNHLTNLIANYEAEIMGFPHYLSLILDERIMSRPTFNECFLNRIENPIINFVPEKTWGKNSQEYKDKLKLLFEYKSSYFKNKAKIVISRKQYLEDSLCIESYKSAVQDQLTEANSLLNYMLDLEGTLQHQSDDSIYLHPFKAVLQNDIEYYNAIYTAEHFEAKLISLNMIYMGYDQLLNIDDEFSENHLSRDEYLKMIQDYLDENSDIIELMRKIQADTSCTESVRDSLEKIIAKYPHNKIIRFYQYANFKNDIDLLNFAFAHSHVLPNKADRLSFKEDSLMAIESLHNKKRTVDILIAHPDALPNLEIDKYLEVLILTLEIRAECRNNIDTETNPVVKAELEEQFASHTLKTKKLINTAKEQIEFSNNAENLLKLYQLNYLHLGFELAMKLFEERIIKLTGSNQALVRSGANVGNAALLLIKHDINERLKLGLVDTNAFAKKMNLTDKVQTADLNNMMTPITEVGLVANINAYLKK